MSIVLPAVSTGHPSIYGFSALLTVYSFTLIGPCPIPYGFPSLPIHFYSNHWLFISIQGHGCSFHCPAAAHCTATDRRSSLHACRHCPWLLHHRPLPLCHRPQRLNLIFVPLHSLLISPLLPLGFHRCYRNQYILCI
jgi:hypothetical protein